MEKVQAYWFQHISSLVGAQFQLQEQLQALQAEFDAFKVKHEPSPNPANAQAPTT